MKFVSITSAAGGVGTTTVTAQLASMLAVRDRPVIVFDFSPQNALRLHFGMSWEDGNGLIPQVLSGKPWHEAAYRCDNGVDFLPYGKCCEQDVAAFSRLLQQEPGWLSARLDELDANDDAFILFDCPGNAYELGSQAYALSDLILTVVAADPVSYAALAGFHDCLAPEHEGKVGYLINDFDPTRELDRDIARLLRAEQGERLCSATIHRDESVREALASKLSVHAYAPHSQAADDYAALSTWLVARLAKTSRPSP
jgi:cellulose synthase operon protein YhjQ